MKASRRDFFKFVLAGSVAAGCPVEHSAGALDPAPSLLPGRAESKTQIGGEHYEICHQVRDGKHFTRAPVSKRSDVVIVGGGISGLTAAYLLQSKDFLLLEKEPHWGGNAYQEEYQGQAFGTGSAFEVAGEPGDQLATEIGLKLLPIREPDPTILNGVWVPDLWRAGIDRLPYSAAVRESFKKFRRDMLAIAVAQRRDELDNEPLSKYCAGYAPEIKKWWDAYGPSNWGAPSDETSTYVALLDFATFAAEDKPDTRVTLPGGLGVLSKRLAEILTSKHRERLLAGATVIAVEPQKNEVHVTYSHGAQLKTVAAKAVIMATPKFITKHVVAGLPAEQSEAMRRIRYLPYPVINVIFDKPVYSRGYDTWCPGNSFTDFIVADWVTIKNQPGYKPKNNILTFYTPLRQDERFRLMSLESCRQIASEVVRDFRLLMHGFDVDPIEVHMYRRGHPMFMASPGIYTKWMPIASHPLERVFFANTDSLGPESLSSAAVVAAQRAAEWVEKILAGGPAAHRTA